MESPPRPPFCTKIHPNFSEVVQALAGQSIASITRAIFASEGLLDAVLQKVIDILDMELVQLTKRNTNPPSLFRQIPLDDTLPQFRWYNCIDELKVKAPSALQLASALVSKNDNGNQKKCGDAHFPGICMLIGIMLKERNREMCGIQTLLSLILFSSCVQKQVICENHYIVDTHKLSIFSFFRSTLGLTM